MSGLWRCVVLYVLLGCGGSTTSSSTSKFDAWEGIWNYTITPSGQCFGGPFSGAVTILAGSATDTVVTEFPGDAVCYLTWTVSGNTATLQSREVCPDSIGTLAYTSGELALTAKQISLSDTGEITDIHDPNGTFGLPMSCTFNETGVLTQN